MRYPAGFGNAPGKMLLTHLRPERCLLGRTGKTDESEMLEATLDQMISTHTGDLGRVGKDVDHPTHFVAPVTDDNRRDSQPQHLVQAIAIPHDDAVGIKGLQQRPGKFEPTRLPKKGPRSVVMGIVR